MKKLLLTLSAGLLLICAVSCVIAEEKTGILIDTSKLVAFDDFDDAGDFELHSDEFEKKVFSNAEVAKGSVFVELEAGDYTGVFLQCNNDINSEVQFPIIAKGSESSYTGTATEGFFTVTKGKVLDVISIDVPKK